jgi:hypothetical protein
VKPYSLPDPQKQPEAFLVLLYKTLKRVEFDDRAWDKIFFGRCMKRVQELAGALDNDFMATALCMKDLAEKFYEAGLDWTIETIISHSFEWKADRQRKSERECFQRLMGAYAGGDLKQLARVDPSGIVAALAENSIRMIAPPPKKIREPDPVLSEEDREEALRVLAEAKEKFSKNKRLKEAEII